MKPHAGILAEIIILLALALAVPAKADGIFSLRIGYNDYPYYGGYYNYWQDYSWYGYWPYYYSPVYFGNFYPFYYPFYPSYYSYFYYRPYIPFYYSHRCYPWYSCPYYSHYRHDRDHKSYDHYSHRDRHHSHDRHASSEPYRNYDQYQQRRSFQQESATTGKNRPYRSYTDDGRAPVTIFRNSQVADRRAGNPAFNYSGRDKAEVNPGDNKINILSRQQLRQAPVVYSPSVRGTTRILRNTNHTAIPSYTVPARKRSNAVVQPAPPGRGPAYVRQIPRQQSSNGKPTGNKKLSFGRPVTKTAVVPSHRQALVQPGRRTDYAQAQSSPRQYRGRDNRQPAAGDSSKGSQRTQKQRESRE